MSNYDKAAEALRQTIVDHSVRIMSGEQQTRTQDEIKAEIRASSKAKALRFLTGTVRAGLNKGWQLLIWIASMGAWLLMPCLGVLFAGMIVEGIDTSTDLGQGAVIAAYAVGIVAGCRAAHDAGNGIRQQFGGMKW